MRNLCVDQEATIRMEHETMDWFKIGQGVWQGYVLSPSVFNLYTEYIIRMPGWMNDKLESRLTGEIPIISDISVIPV